jgi:hypothetical protein
MPAFDNPALPRVRTDHLGSNSVNIGTVHADSAAYLIAEDFGNFFMHQTVLTLTSLPVVTGNTSGASFGSKQLFTFPEGRINIICCAAYFGTITFNTAAGATGDIDGAGSGDYAIGTTATADATIAGTDVNILPSTAMLDPFVAGVGRSNVGSVLAAAALFDGTSTATPVFLNVIIDDADVSDLAASDSVFFTGQVRITWQWLGDI